MAKILKFRRGTTTQHNTFTGVLGEITVDTTKNTAVVHDGVTAGGNPLAKQSTVDSQVDIHNKIAKTTLDDGDELGVADSVSTFSLKKITWANIKTAFSNVFTPKVATSTNRGIAIFNGTSGLLQNSTLTIDNNGNIGSGSQTFNGFGGTGYKNMLINGSMNVWQRALNFAGYSSSTYTADRWTAEFTGVAPTIYRGGALGWSDGCEYSYGVNGIAGNTSFALYQKIEDINCGKLYDGNIVTLSLSIFRNGLASSKTLNLNLINTADYSYSVGGNITIPAGSGTFRTSVTFTIASGSNKFNAGTRVGIVCTNGLVAGEILAFSGIQLEEGSIATRFEFRDGAIERDLCYRYYQKSYNENYFAGNATYSGAFRTRVASDDKSHFDNGHIAFKKKMRIAPSVALYASGVANTLGMWDETVSASYNTAGTFIANLGEDGFNILDSYFGTTLNHKYSFQYTASAEL